MSTKFMVLTRLLVRAVQRLLGCAMILVLLIGCHGQANVAPPNVMTATGTLSYQRHPVANAQMTFHGTSSEDSGFAITDSQGRFRCVTNDSGSGMIPGDYVITVVSPRGDIPKQYADPETSTLSITVEEEAENVFPLILTD